MTIYETPQCPEDLQALYDNEGTIWSRGADDLWYSSDSVSVSWEYLVALYGPLTTDTPPFAVGEYISFQDFWNMPIGSVVKEKHYAAMTRTNYGVIFGEERFTSPSNYSLQYMKNLQILHIGEEDE